MINLVAAAATFLGLHFLVAGTRLRDAAIAATGPRTYLGVLALFILSSLVWLCFAYGAARQTSDIVYWSATPMTKWLQLGLTLIAFLFVVPGRTVRNPAGVLQEGSLARPDIVKGMLRVTRHPYLWGVAIWAAGHLLVNGNAASFILFGAFFILALIGTFSIDAKRHRLLGEQWDVFARQTSNVPFAAIFAGRQSLNLGEIGWWRFGLALAFWVVLIVAHPYLFGAATLP